MYIGQNNHYVMITVANELLLAMIYIVEGNKTVGMIRVNLENLAIKSLKYIGDTMFNSYSCK